MSTRKKTRNMADTHLMTDSRIGSSAAKQRQLGTLSHDRIMPSCGTWSGILDCEPLSATTVMSTDGQRRCEGLTWNVCSSAALNLIRNVWKTKSGRLDSTTTAHRAAMDRIKEVLSALRSGGTDIRLTFASETLITSCRGRQCGRKGRRSGGEE